MPFRWLQRVKNKIQGTSPLSPISMEDEICLTWILILQMSQSNFPQPPKIEARTEIIHKVHTIHWTVDENIAQDLVLPLLGEDKDLIKMLVLFAHTQTIPNIGSTTFLRSKKATAITVRLSSAGIYFPNVMNSVKEIISSSCIKCRESAPPFQEIQHAHHGLQPGVPF